MAALTTVITHATGDVYPASDFNTYTRDNFNWLIQAGADTTIVANAVTVTNEYHHVTGGGTLNTITHMSPVKGQRVRLLFTAATTLTSGVGNVYTLAGVSRVADANEIVEFAFDGANWREATSQTGIGTIYDNTLGGSATSVATGTLPTIYNHLLVVCYGRTDSGGSGGDYLGVRFNGDAGNNYDWSAPNGSTGSGTSRAAVGYSVGGAAVANLFAGTLLIIPNYRDAANRKVMFGIAAGLTSNVPAVVGNANISVGTWRTNATPITSLTFVSDPTPGTTNFVAGSKFTVYGLN